MTMPEKKRDFSVICSNQESTLGHRQRLRFVRALKNHFGDRIDWFGNGVNSIPTKWEGLADYRFSLVVENQQRSNIITEKLWDPILTWTTPIYAGAPNVHDYLPNEALTTIDIDDLAGSITLIEELLSTPTSVDIDALGRAREQVLGPLNLYTRLAAVAHERQGLGDRDRVTLTPRVQIPAQAEHISATRKLGEFFNKIGDTLVQRSLER
jgi:hypothetical protein